MKILLLLVCLVIQETIGGRLRRVIGAYEVDIVEVPYQVSLRYQGGHFCGGVLISLTHVLTVAHCVAKFEPPYDKITVVTGTNSLQDGGTHHKVKNVKCHDKYRYQGLRNDIAVLTLSVYVKPNNKQKPVSLPIGDPSTIVIGTISGFGIAMLGTLQPSVTLRGFTTTILPLAVCQQIYNGYGLHKEHFCAVQEKGTAISKGDSGGALVCNGRIVGLSMSGPTNLTGYPDVYVDVYQYLEFIDDAMQG